MIEQPAGHTQTWTTSTIMEPMVSLGDDLEQRWYTHTEAARVARVHPRTIRRWVTRRKLRSTAGHVNAMDLARVERERRRARHAGNPGPRFRLPT